MIHDENIFLSLLRFFLFLFIPSIIGVVQMVNKKSGVFTAAGKTPFRF